MIASYGICLLTLPFATSISFNKCSCVQGVNTPGMCSMQYVRYSYVFLIEATSHFSMHLKTPILILDSILKISCLTPKDREDLNYMLSIGVDWVALSFVQRPEDIVEIKGLIMEYNPQK